MPMSGRTAMRQLQLFTSLSERASKRTFFQHYAGKRPVYALDLPGYGMSERRDQTYTARMMADAILAAVDEIKRLHDGEKVDVMALSVSCEYAARAALERPTDIRSLGLISPTGFDKALSGYGRAQSTKGNAVKPWSPCRSGAKPCSISS